MRKIIIFCMIFVVMNVSAQYNLPHHFTGKPLTLFPSTFKSNFISPVMYSTSVNTSFLLTKESFFCRRERLFENVTNIPLRIRMGSLPYCNWLEGKPNTVFDK